MHVTDILWQLFRISQTSFKNYLVYIYTHIYSHWYSSKMFRIEVAYSFRIINYRDQMDKTPSMQYDTWIYQTFSHMSVKHICPCESSSEQTLRQTLAAELALLRNDGPSSNIFCTSTILCFWNLKLNLSICIKICLLSSLMHTNVLQVL